MKKSRSLRLIREYERFRSSTLNLIPSENVLSPDVMAALASPMAGRYAGKPETYGGSAKFHEIWTYCEDLARKVFRAKFATVMPVSGHIAAMIAVDSLCRKGDRLSSVRAEQGGYKGYTAGYIPEIFGLEFSPLPFDAEHWNLDTTRAAAQLERERPPLVVLGATVFLFPHSVKEISRVVHSYSGHVIYDASHVMGLIAGGCFQDPLGEGADVVLGSTHKTLFGPQGGLILTNREDIWTKIEGRILYRFVDNFHLNRVSALGVALEEVRAHGKAYARQVIRNAKTLAKNLAEAGAPVVARDSDFTESHQVFLDYGDEGSSIRDTLETNGIISDSRVRLGTNEVTRRGMGRAEMAEVSSLATKTLRNPRSEKIRKKVHRLVRAHPGIMYTL